MPAVEGAAPPPDRSLIGKYLSEPCRRERGVGCMIKGVGARTGGRGRKPLGVTRAKTWEREHGTTGSWYAYLKLGRKTKGD
ncbi:hypothetical protein PAHAL_5G514400 [Panicum hallii]|uniref:Uncharacterized protein n=1 Tax=Panicum hallii TaxID=206008 RepID=A0A2S3HYR8_9POAL|nr:hypothetical protein PAHAL_5G514400 [Panicum hallii]